MTLAAVHTSVGLLDDDDVFRSVVRSVVSSSTRVKVHREWSDLAHFLADDPWEGIDVVVSDLVLGPIGSPSPTSGLIRFLRTTEGKAVLLLSSLDEASALRGVPVLLRPRFSYLKKSVDLTSTTLLSEIERLVGP